MRTIQAASLAIAIAVAVPTVMAIDVKVNFDKTFAFKDAHTWDWSPTGPGDVKMARTSQDNPEDFRKLAEPIILSAVTMEMGRSRLKQKTEAPDVVLRYFLLLSTSASAQTVGQFLPSTTQWGIPPFVASTQSLEVMKQGSLVLDFSAEGHVVWRGVAQAQIKMDADDKKQESVLRGAVRDLLRRFPPKP